MNWHCCDAIISIKVTISIAIRCHIQLQYIKVNYDNVRLYGYSSNIYIYNIYSHLFIHS